MIRQHEQGRRSADGKQTLGRGSRSGSRPGSSVARCAATPRRCTGTTSPCIWSPTLGITGWSICAEVTSPRRTTGCAGTGTERSRRPKSSTTSGGPRRRPRTGSSIRAALGCRTWCPCRGRSALDHPPDPHPAVVRADQRGQGRRDPVQPGEQRRTAAARCAQGEGLGRRAGRRVPRRDRGAPVARAVPPRRLHRHAPRRAVRPVLRPASPMSSLGWPGSPACPISSSTAWAIWRSRCSRGRGRVELGSGSGFRP